LRARAGCGTYGAADDVSLRTQEAAGGLAVKVTDGFFLIGLSNVEADYTRNLQLLKERSWCDMPLVYVNQRRAIIAIEKGAPGERAFNDAFAAWGE
jgi:hypothetical protein